MQVKHQRFCSKELTENEAGQEEKKDKIESLTVRLGLGADFVSPSSTAFYLTVLYYWFENQRHDNAQAEMEDNTATVDTLTKEIEVLQKQARPKYFTIFCQSSKDIF